MITLPSDTLNALAQECHATAQEKGWYEQERGIPELLCLIHAELSECLEAARNGCPSSTHCPRISSIAEELADAVIRILDMSAFLGIDIGQAVIEKMAFNRLRPHRHGGKAY